MYLAQASQAKKFQTSVVVFNIIQFFSFLNHNMLIVINIIYYLSLLLISVLIFIIIVIIIELLNHF